MSHFYRYISFTAPLLISALFDIEGRLLLVREALKEMAEDQLSSK